MCTLSQFYKPEVRAHVCVRAQCTIKRRPSYVFECIQCSIAHATHRSCTAAPGQLCRLHRRLQLPGRKQCVVVHAAQQMHAQALKDGYAFCTGGYGCPPGDSDLPTCINHIKALPRQEAPEVFGLHANAAIAFNLQVGVQARPPRAHAHIDAQEGKHVRTQKGTCTPMYPDP